MSENIIELYSTAQIAERVKTLAAEISLAYTGQDLLVFCAHEDSFIFLADLLRSLSIHPQTTFLRHDDHTLGGMKDLSFATSIDVSKKDILLLTGVFETGVTQDYLIKQLIGRGANSVKLCVLLYKPESRHVELEPDWFAFETREDYVFGYGLELQHRWRELSFLATFVNKTVSAT